LLNCSAAFVFRFDRPEDAPSRAGVSSSALSPRPVVARSVMVFPCTSPGLSTDSDDLLKA
jgi:hypothetical protein